MFELTRRRLTHSEAYPHFMSILHHCLQMPCECSDRVGAMETWDSVQSAYSVFSAVLTRLGHTRDPKPQLCGSPVFVSSQIKGSYEILKTK